MIVSDPLSPLGRRGGASMDQIYFSQDPRLPCRSLHCNQMIVIIQFTLVLFKSWCKLVYLAYITTLTFTILLALTTHWPSTLSGSFLTTFTVTFRALSRRFCPKRLTWSKFVTNNKCFCLKGCYGLKFNFYNGTAVHTLGIRSKHHLKLSVSCSPHRCPDLHLRPIPPSPQDNKYVGPQLSACGWICLLPLIYDYWSAGAAQHDLEALIRS